MKFVNIGFLFVSCYAESSATTTTTIDPTCEANKFCKNDCICGNGEVIKNCNEGDYCINPGQTTADNLIKSTKLLKHYNIAIDGTYFCVKHDNITARKCNKDDMCNIYGLELCVPKASRVEHGTFAEENSKSCVMQTMPVITCNQNEYCNKNAIKQADTCLTYANNLTNVQDNKQRVCTTVKKNDILTANMTASNVITNICNHSPPQYCANGMCIDNCKENHFCNPDKECKCHTDATTTDCKLTNQYCESKNKKPLTVIEQTFLTHSQQGNGKLYCVQGGKLLPNENTIAALCTEKQICNIGGINPGTLCITGSNLTTLDDGEQTSPTSEDKNQCFYSNGYKACGASEICVKSATAPETACVLAKTYALIQHILAGCKSGESDIAAVSAVSENLKNLKTELIEKIGECGGEKEDNTTIEANTSSNDVKGIAIGALIVGVINLILIGSVLVLLLCFNNNKGNTGKKENA